MPYIFLLLSFILATDDNGCLGSSRSKVHIQWSEPANYVAPNGRVFISVKPDFADDENRTKVSLNSCRGERYRLLFTLTRNAEVNWSYDGERILVVDKPGADYYHVLFSNHVSNAFSSRRWQLSDLNRIISPEISKHLGKNRKIEFYLPRFVSWTSTGFVISVGGRSSTASDGPMKGYCYGIVIDGVGSVVQRVLSLGELKSEFQGDCQSSP